MVEPPHETGLCHDLLDLLLGQVLQFGQLDGYRVFREFGLSSIEAGLLGGRSRTRMAERLRHDRQLGGLAGLLGDAEEVIGSRPDANSELAEGDLTEGALA